MTWWEYVERTADTERQRDIAERTGIDATNISRWKSGQIPKAPVVAQFARAYQRPVLEAFVAAGFLTPEEAGEKPVAAPSLDDIPDEQLLEALLERLRLIRNEIVHFQGSGKTASFVESQTRRARLITAGQPVETAAGSTSPRHAEPEPESQDVDDMEPR